MSTGPFCALWARYCNLPTGRFTQEDTHWSPDNMIYGDDPLKLNEYTLTPNLPAIAQSGNLYPYAMGNPVLYRDSTGEFAATILTTIIGAAGGALGAYLKGDSVKNGAIAGAVGGAISGLFIDIGASLTVQTAGASILAATAVGSVVGSLAGNIMEQVLNGTSINSLDLSSALKSAGVAGGFSLVGFGIGKVVGGVFKLTPVGTTAMERLIDSLRKMDMTSSSIIVFLTTVFQEMPRAMADTLVNGTEEATQRRSGGYGQA